MTMFCLQCGKEVDAYFGAFDDAGDNHKITVKCHGKMFSKTVSNLKITKATTELESLNPNIELSSIDLVSDFENEEVFFRTPKSGLVKAT